MEADRLDPLIRDSANQPIRRIQARPGLWCWTSDRAMIALPKGLERDRLAIIVGHSGRDWEILCMDRRWVVDIRCLSLPCEYRTRRNRWISEFDPRVGTYLRAKLAAYRARYATETHASRQGTWNDFIRSLKRELRRNGWDAPDLPDEY